jgi:hypothetical protein
MWHKNRQWNITDALNSATLAFDMTRIDWTLCTAWRLPTKEGNLLFLNDSLSEDGAVEYGVVHEETLIQIESLTIRDQEQAARLIQQTVETFEEKGPLGSIVTDVPQVAQWQLTTHGERCYFCA